MPAPADGGVLALTGRVGTTNVDGSLRLDQDALSRLGLVQATIYDPWTEAEIEVQGVWLADLLAFAQVDESVTRINLTALDDYTVDLSMADIRAGGILLATRDGNGEPIPVSEGGPTRIVFVGDVAAGTRPELWIWSLRTIDAT